MTGTYALLAILAVGLFLGLYPAMQRDENAEASRRIDDDDLAGGPQ